MKFRFWQLLVLLMLLGVQLHAAGPEGRDRVQDFKMWKLMQVLNLSQDQSGKFIPIFSDLERLSQGFIESKQNYLRKLDPMVEAKNTDQGAVERLLNDLDREETEFLKRRRDLESGMFKVLTPLQRAAYVKFEADFPKMLRELLREQNEPRSGEGARDERSFDKMERPRMERPINRNRWD